jgi:hypothetical protein
MKMVKKYVVLQVNDAADRLRLIVFLSKVQFYMYRLQNILDGGGE